MSEVTIVLRPSPFAADQRVVRVPPDCTLGEIAEAVRLPAEDLVIALDGDEVPRSAWAATRPAAGAHVAVVRKPRGAQILTALLQIATAAAVQYTIARLTAPDIPDAGEGGTGKRISITGNRNRVARYEAVPTVIGEMRVTPPLAAASYTVVKGGKLYQYSLFTFGPGVLNLSDLRIGKDPLFADGTTLQYTGVMASNTRFENIRLELRRGTDSDAAVTLFATDVQETLIERRVRHANGWIVRRSPSGATKLTVIVGFLGGLYWQRDSGGIKQAAVRIDVEYRSATSTGAWTQLGLVQAAAASRDSKYFAVSAEVSEGTYDVRVRRITADATDPGVVDQVHWVTLLAQRQGEPVRREGLCLVAMEAQLTEQFVDPIDQLNAVATRVATAWNQAVVNWVEQETSSPAAALRYVLQAPERLAAVPDDRIDLDQLVAWTLECESRGLEFNAVLSSRQTTKDVCDAIAAAGIAEYGVIDGLHTVIREPSLTGSPAQYLTPRNSVAEPTRIEFPRPLHGLRVEWIDPASEWVTTERIVPNDGYTEQTATETERLSLLGVTGDAQAYKLGRFALARRELRREAFVRETDFESLDLRRGAWVRLFADEALLGLACGRITAVALDGGGACTGVTVDEPCPMAAATYELRVRRTSNGATIERAITAVAGEQTTLAFTSSIAAGQPHPAVGDLFVFGETGLSAYDCRVRAVEPGQRLRFRLTLEAAAPGILTAALGGAIPAWDPRISLPPEQQPAAPPAPRVASVEPVALRPGECLQRPSTLGIRIALSPAAPAAVQP